VLNVVLNNDPSLCHSSSIRHVSLVRCCGAEL